MSTVHKIHTAEEIAASRPTEQVFLRLPTRRLFGERAARLRQLSHSHPMADFLSFMARVADQQQHLLDNMPAVPVPTPASLAQCHEHGMPPVNANAHPRDRVWCDMLRRMLRALADDADGDLRKLLVQLEGERDELYEAQASKLLAGVTFGLQMATAPLIGAALQVYWMHMTTTLGRDSFPTIDIANLCPCCGQRPTASIARIGTEQSGGRYLVCSLCAAEWHMVRIKCAGCEASDKIHYDSIENDQPGKQQAIKAECCDECGSYLKIMYQDRDPNIEPVADDLATLSLDLLVGDTGKQPIGVNLMLIHGDPGDS
jgi:FdhE protein